MKWNKITEELPPHDRLEIVLKNILKVWTSLQ